MPFAPSSLYVGRGTEKMSLVPPSLHRRQARLTALGTDLKGVTEKTELVILLEQLFVE